jgi:hypothetical protein
MGHVDNKLGASKHVLAAFSVAGGVPMVAALDGRLLLAQRAP